MKTIWKFKLTPEVNTLLMPSGARILNVNTQVEGGEENVFLWAEVDVSKDTIKEPRSFDIYGTDHQIRQGMGINLLYIGTAFFKTMPLVLHVYESL
jgi:hypothetical protein